MMVFNRSGSQDDPRIARFAALTSALFSSESVDDIRGIVEKEVPLLTSAAAGIVGFFGEDGQLKIAHSFGYSPEEVEVWRTSALHALRTKEPAGTPLFFPDAKALREALSLSAPPPTRAAWAILPFVSKGLARGVVTLAFDTPHEFSADDQMLLVGLMTVWAGATRRTLAAEGVALQRSRFERHEQTLVRLALSTSTDPIERLLAEANAALGTIRATLWRFTRNGSHLACVGLHEEEPGGLKPRTLLARTDLPKFIAALHDTRTLAVTDAATDPRAQDLRAYTAAMGVTSFLDAPVRFSGEIDGLVCFEHRGPPREWFPEEESFAASLADLIALALESQERARDAAALREREALLGLVLDQMPGVVYTTDRELRVTSSAGRGPPGSTLAPPPIGSSILEFLKLGDPAAESLLQRALAGESVTSETTFDERIFDSHTAPLRDADGHIVGTIGVAFEVTERKRLEEAQRTSRARIDLLLAQMPALICTTDLTLRVTSAAGHLPEVIPNTESLIGKRLQDIIGTEDPENVYAAPYHRALKGEHAATEFPWAGRMVDVRTDALRDEEDNIVGTVSIAFDVTNRANEQRELTQARRELAASEKLAAIGTLVSGVAHEIRTPLAYVNNSAHLIQLRLERAAKEGLLPPDLVRELMHPTHAIVDGVDRMTRLVRDLRRSSRHSIERETFALDDVVDDARRLFEATRPGDRITCQLKSGRRVNADKTAIQQVVLNLLENARDATPPGGRVTLTTMPTPRGAGIVVEDEGPGVPESMHDHMWDPFFTTKPEGTGLGLSIVRRIAEAHEGSATYEARPTGGSRFVVELPATD